MSGWGILDLREFLRLYLIYFGAGVAVTPWAIAYGFLRGQTFGHWLIEFVVIIGGFLTALFVWNFLNKKYSTTHVIEYTETMILDNVIFFNQPPEASSNTSTIIFSVNLETSSSHKFFLGDDEMNESQTYAQAQCF